MLCRRGVHHLRAKAMATQILPSASDLVNRDSPSPSQRSPPPPAYTIGRQHTLYTIHGKPCNKHHRTAELCHTQRHHVYTAVCKRFPVQHVKCAMQHHLSTTSGFFIGNGPHTLRNVGPAASIGGACLPFDLSRNNVVWLGLKPASACSLWAKMHGHC